MRVWIDLANSPHPLLFAPVAREIAERGGELAVTVREHAQTAELALARWPEAEVIGAGAGPEGAGRIGALAGRARSLRRWARRRRLDIALSHNSYAQIAAARTLGLGVLTAMDYEHQPLNHLAFRLAHRTLVPEALPAGRLRAQGASARKLVRFPGLKEELYLGDFDPDPEILSRLGVERGPDEAVVVLRSAPAGAAYHRKESPIFTELLETLDRRPQLTAIALARHAEQRRAVRALDLERTIVPERAIDSRSLLLAADAFIGAGGTMTREAALIGLPTQSVFSGRWAAVDESLRREGRLRRLELAQDVGEIVPLREREPAIAALRGRGERLRHLFVDQVVALFERRAR